MNEVLQPLPRIELENDRFVLPLPEGEGEVNYVPEDGAWDYVRTFIPPEARERGHGERLVLFALAYAREHGHRVIPTCPFVRYVLGRHREYQDLIEPVEE